MRGHGTGFRGEGFRGNQYTAGNESTNLSSAVAQQLQGGESLQQLYYQQQGYPNNMVNGPNHFGVVGQQNPQQQVHSNNMSAATGMSTGHGMSTMMWPRENTYRGTGSSGTQKKYPSENDIQVKPAGSLYDPAQIGIRQKDILVNPEFFPSLQANPGACFYDPPQIGTRQEDILANLFSPPQATATVVSQKESKVKQITGPVNFGIELLYSKTHNNIELQAQQGAVVQANSAILALNSPVIHHMTTTLELTIIDMEEFSEQSVRCFVEAAYTGSLPSVTQGMFRDLNKIVHAFKVDWLQSSCFEIFRDFSFTDADPGKQLSYADLCFLFDEAAFVFSMLKKENFMDEALNKIKSTGTKQEFITQYLIDHDLEKVAGHQLDMVIKLVGDDVELIVQHLAEKLLARLGLEGAVISPNFRYLLQNCDLSHCLKRNPQLIEQLFDILQEVATNEDLKWVLRLHRKLASL